MNIEELKDKIDAILEEELLKYPMLDLETLDEIQTSIHQLIEEYSKDKGDN